VRQVAKEAESPEAGPWPDTTPERLPKTVLSAVYGLLQVRVGAGRAVCGWVLPWLFRLCPCGFDCPTAYLPDRHTG
jgi:hypothetical protein